MAVVRCPACQQTKTMEEDGDEATTQWLAEWTGCDGWGFGVLERVLDRTTARAKRHAHLLHTPVLTAIVLKEFDVQVGLIALTVVIAPEGTVAVVMGSVNRNPNPPWASHLLEAIWHLC